MTSRESLGTRGHYDEFASMRRGSDRALRRIVLFFWAVISRCQVNTIRKVDGSQPSSYSYSDVSLQTTRAEAISSRMALRLY